MNEFVCLILFLNRRLGLTVATNDVAKLRSSCNSFLVGIQTILEEKKLHITIRVEESVLRAHGLVQG